MDVLEAVPRGSPVVISRRALLVGYVSGLMDEEIEDVVLTRFS